MADSKAETETIISSVLTSNPLRMTIRDLDRQFKEINGYRIPFREFGFSNLEAYLRSIPNCLTVNGRGYEAEVCLVVSEKSAHIDSLIRKQRPGKRRSIHVTPRRIAHQNYQDMFSYHQPPVFNYLTPPTYKPIAIVHHQQRASLRKPYSLFENVPPTSQNVTPKEENVPSSARLRLPHKMSENIPSTTDNAQKIFPPKEERHSNRISVINKTPQNAKEISLTKEEKIPSGASSKSLTCKGVIPKKYVNKNHRSSSSKNNVPYFIQSRLKELISKYPAGLHCNKLSDLYKKEFGHDLNYVDYGYKSVTHFCLDFKSIFDFKRLKDGSIEVFDKNLNLQIEHEQENDIQQLHAVNWDNSHRNNEPPLPDGIEDVLLEFHIKQLSSDIVSDANIIRQWIGANISLEDYIEIEVAEVYDPSKFWIQLRQHIEHLNRLMDQMQIFYRANKDSYYIPCYAIREGMHLACIFDCEYHRAKVIDCTKKKEGTLKVFYIDYGTVAIVRTKMVCYLTQEFVSFPAQAIRARLYGIQPTLKDMPWSQAASSRFLNLVSNTHLVAQVMEIDEEDMILDLIIANTTTPGRDIFINDILIKENLATFTNEELHECASIEYKPTVSNVYLYPKHEELESGRAPTYQAMLHFVASNFSYDRIFPNYFKKIEHDTESKNEESCNSFGNEIDVEINDSDENNLEMIENDSKKVVNDSKIIQNNSEIIENNSLIVTNNIEGAKSNPIIESTPQNVIVNKPETTMQSLRPPPGFSNSPPKHFIDPNLVNALYIANLAANQAVINAMIINRTRNNYYYSPQPTFNNVGHFQNYIPPHLNYPPMMSSPPYNYNPSFNVYNDQQPCYSQSSNINYYPPNYPQYDNVIHVNCTPNAKFQRLPHSFTNESNQSDIISEKSNKHNIKPKFDNINQDKYESKKIKTEENEINTRKRKDFELKNVLQISGKNESQPINEKQSKVVQTEASNETDLEEEIKILTGLLSLKNDEIEKKNSETKSVEEETEMDIKTSIVSKEPKSETKKSLIIKENVKERKIHDKIEEIVINTPITEIEREIKTRVENFIDDRNLTEIHAKQLKDVEKLIKKKTEIINQKPDELKIEIEVQLESVNELQIETKPILNNSKDEQFPNPSFNLTESKVEDLNQCEYNVIEKINNEVEEKIENDNEIKLTENDTKEFIESLYLNDINNDELIENFEAQCLNTNSINSKFNNKVEQCLKIEDDRDINLNKISKGNSKEQCLKPNSFNSPETKFENLPEDQYPKSFNPTESEFEDLNQCTSNNEVEDNLEIEDDIEINLTKTESRERLYLRGVNDDKQKYSVEQYPNSNSFSSSETKLEYSNQSINKKVDQSLKVEDVKEINLTEINEKESNDSLYLKDINYDDLFEEMLNEKSSAERYLYSNSPSSSDCELAYSSQCINKIEQHFEKIENEEINLTETDSKESEKDLNCDKLIENCYENYSSNPNIFNATETENESTQNETDMVHNEDLYEIKVTFHDFGSASLHVITDSGDKYLILQELRKELLNSFSLELVRRTIATAPVLIDIDDISLDEIPCDLKTDLLCNNIVSSSYNKIDIVPVNQIREIFNALYGNVPILDEHHIFLTELDCYFTNNDS